MIEFIWWYGPWTLVALAVVLKLLRIWLLRSKTPDKPVLKIYKPDPELPDPQLPPGFPPGHGYATATREQKERQAHVAWDVYQSKRSNTFEPPYPVDWKTFVKPDTTAEKQSALDQKIEWHKHQSRRSRQDVHDMVIPEIERLLGAAGVAAKKAELGDEGYLAFLDSVVARVEKKYEQRVASMRDFLLCRGGTPADGMALMRGLIAPRDIPSSNGEPPPQA